MDANEPWQKQMALAGLGQLHQPFKGFRRVHDPRSAKQRGQRGVIRMHRQHHSTTLGHRKQFIQQPFKMHPQTLRSQTSSGFVETRIRWPIPQQHGLLDVLQTKCRGQRAATLRSIQPRTTPVSSSHEVVTEQPDVQIGHLLNQSLQRPKFAAVVPTQFDVFNRQIALHHTALHAE
jgi:hypothetical protein